MALLSKSRPVRKRRHQYHHGDLRRALVQEAVRTIGADGVEGLTLRAVGERLGVSRTALYRHFTDKSSLLAAVGLEGFRAFHEAMRAAAQAPAAAGFDAMGRAYLEFARAHPAHYRVMFGGFLEGCKSEPALADEAAASFQVLVEALRLQQQAGLLRDDDPEQMARFVWSVVHGIAMLTIDGQLAGHDTMRELDYAIGRLSAALGRQRT
jgi:AcrR family transcriptional regulator